ENPPKVLLVREDPFLHGKIDPCTVHQINDGQTVLHGDFLGPEVFLAADRKPCPCLDRGIIGHHHTLPSLDITDLDHNAPTGTSPVIGVHSIPCKGRYLEG